MIRREILKKIRQVKTCAESMAQSAVIGIRITLGLGLLPAAGIAGAAPPQIPADVVMNEESGRGGWLIVSLRLETGDELRCIVDTGCPVTILDKILEPKLGNQLHSFTVWTMFGKQKSGLYSAPKLYLGETALMTGGHIATYDFRKVSAFRRANIRAILGLDCLEHYCIQLDFPAGRLRFLQDGPLKTNELGAAFPLSLPGNDTRDGFLNRFLSIQHTGLLGGTNTHLMIDTGFNADGAIDRGVLKGHYLTRFVHQLVPSRALRIKESEWGGHTYTDLKVGTGWNVLGLRFLARHVVTFDFPNKTMYLKQTSVGPFEGYGEPQEKENTP